MEYNQLFICVYSHSHYLYIRLDSLLGDKSEFIFSVFLSLLSEFLFRLPVTVVSLGYASFHPRLLS